MAASALARTGAKTGRRAPLVHSFRLVYEPAPASGLNDLDEAFALFGDLPEPANDVAPEARPAPQSPRRNVFIEPHLAMRVFPALDWAAAALAAQTAALWGAGAGLGALPLADAAAYVFSALALKMGLWLTESYRVTPAQIRPEHGLGGLALGAVAGLALSNLLAPDARGAAALAAVLPATAFLLAALRAGLAVLIRAGWRAGMFSENVVVVGATRAARRFIVRARRGGDVRVLAVADDRLSRAPATLAGAPVACGLDDLLRWEGLPHIDRIVIALPPGAEARIGDALERLSAAPNRIDLLLPYGAGEVHGGQLGALAGSPVACLSGRIRNTGHVLIKRTLDLTLGAALAALMLAPMLAIALAVRLDSRGPALLRQRRLGFNHRTFTMFKFRTLSGERGGVTRLGQFLRRTGLDNLPQLFNVIAGDMSLVGPRPHLCAMQAGARDLRRAVANYAHRHRAKPGITGWAQINGAPGLPSTPACMRQSHRLDVEYIARASFWLDLRILFCSARLFVQRLRR